MATLWASSRQCFPGVNRPSLQRVYSQSVMPGPLRPLHPSSYHAVRFRPDFPFRQDRRQLLTLAIESSCDDSCVAILERDGAGRARLHFNERISLNNRAHKGIHPLEATCSHTTHLAELTRKALSALPKVDPATLERENNRDGILSVHGDLHLKPDFISVTRGPGMPSSLVTGLNIAKGLAVAWGVPLLAVNHMQAHALTPRLVSALEKKEVLKALNQPPGTEYEENTQRPQFPFLSLLVSGGHTILVRSLSLTEHAILAESDNIAVGDMLDKCARLILPNEILSVDTKLTMFGPLLEEFAFPGSIVSSKGTIDKGPGEILEYDYGYKPPCRRKEEIASFDSGLGWSLTPPLSRMGQAERAASMYNFAGLNGQVQQIMLSNPNMGIDERRDLARATMRLVFEHLATRVLFALKATVPLPKAAEQQDGLKVNTLVLSGGVASNKYLRHIMRAMLDIRGHTDVEMIAPPVSLCTDNAAMIAWTGMEMYEAGFRSGLEVPLLRKWPLDPSAEDGGILGVPGWYSVA
jgi:N6-L-threonylcarbamoyladenine synthase